MKDKILQEIDSRIANAHELPDVNPQKAYWEGWDAALQAIYEFVEGM